MKSCSICGKEKVIDLFYKHTYSKGGYRSHCKECANKFRTPRFKWSDGRKQKAHEWEAYHRKNLTDWWIKKTILTNSKGTIKTSQITPEMIRDQREKLLKLRFKRENHLLKKDSIIKGPYKCKCSVCGIDFLGAFRRSNVCSEECNHNKQLKRLRRIYKERWQAPESFKCKECGKIVIPKFGMKRDKYCSDKCMNKSGKINLSARRRLRMIDGFVERISKTIIFERDRGHCQICGKKVNKDLKHPHLMSATLDHIIPLARGGRHERKNVRLTHMICNSIKRDIASPNGDQLLLFG